MKRSRLSRKGTKARKQRLKINSGLSHAEINEYFSLLPPFGNVSGDLQRSNELEMKMSSSQRKIMNHAFDLIENGFNFNAFSYSEKVFAKAHTGLLKNIKKGKV